MADYKLMSIQEQTFVRMLSEQNSTLEKINKTLEGGFAGGLHLNDFYVSMLDGTRNAYNRAMRGWFLANGADKATPEELTALCDKWYSITRQKWTGGQKFTQPTDSAAPSAGEKYGDNAGLTCTPSTETVHNADDYEGLPLFATKDCNWILSGTGEILITAIDGINDSFERDNPEKLVGVLQQSMFVLRKEETDTYSVGVSSVKVGGYDYCKPLPESVKRDGTMRQWMLHTKYQAGMVNSKPTACSGVKPTTESHNSEIGDSHILGQYYSATCHCDYDFIELMKQVKYGLASDGIIQGCCDYFIHTLAKVAETGVRRVLIASNPGFVVGSTVKVANVTSVSDTWGLRNATAIAWCKIRSFENVTIGESTYVAVNLDTDTLFDTTVNEDIANGNTVIMTMPWMTGSTDAVDANDGGINPKSGKYPVKIQGIEYMLGQYEVVEDTILQYEADGKCYEYIINDATKESTTITSDFVKHGGTPIPASSSWQYIKKMGYDGAFYPLVLGGSSSIGHKDATYILAATSGMYELLLFGGLGLGSGNAGVSYSDRHDGLSNRAWFIGSRLSPNGNRGEWGA